MPQSKTRSLEPVCRPSLADRRGSVGVITAIIAPFLIVGLAISVDSAYWRYRQTVLQSSADTSAVSVVYEITSIANHANGGNIVDNNTSFPIVYSVGGASKTFLSIGAYANFLTATAQFDSKRNCTETGGFACSAAMTWPVSTDYSSAYVVTSDNTARRFFSSAISSGAKVMSSHAVASTSGTTTSTTTTTTGGSPDDGCIMSLSGIVTFVNSSYVDSPCTVIANGGNVDVEADSYVAGTGYATGIVTSGYIHTGNAHNGVAYGGQQMSNQAAVADPYAPSTAYPAALRSGSSAGSTAFPVNAATATSVPCNDVYGGGIMQRGSALSPTAPSADGDARNNASPYTGAYNQDAAGDVNAMHPFKGFKLNADGSYTITGGARFCTGLQISNLTVNFGPGTYLIEGTVNISSSTINADGATLVYNLANPSNLQGTTFNLRAPPAGTAFPVFGPSGVGDLSRGIAGIVMTSGNTNTANLAIDGTNVFQFQGDIYLPTNPWVSQSGMQLGAVTFGGAVGGGVSTGTITASGTAACGRVIVKSFTDYGSATIGNTCTSANGVQPFGTSFGASGSGGWSGSGQKTTTKTSTTGHTYPRVTQ